MYAHLRLMWELCMSLSLYLCLLHVLFYIYLVLLLAIVYHDFGILQKL